MNQRFAFAGTGYYWQSSRLISLKLFRFPFLICPHGLWASLRQPHSSALLRTGALSRLRCSLAVNSKLFVVPAQFSCSSLFTVSQRELILALAARHSVCALKTRSAIARTPRIRQSLVRCLPLLRTTREYDWTGR